MSQLETIDWMNFNVHRPAWARALFAVDGATFRKEFDCLSPIGKYRVGIHALDMVVRQLSGSNGEDFQTECLRWDMAGIIKHIEGSKISGSLLSGYLALAKGWILLGVAGEETQPLLKAKEGLRFALQAKSEPGRGELIEGAAQLWLTAARLKRRTTSVREDLALKEIEELQSILSAADLKGVSEIERVRRSASIAKGMHLVRRSHPNEGYEILEKERASSKGNESIDKFLQTTRHEVPGLGRVVAAVKEFVSSNYSGLEFQKRFIQDVATIASHRILSRGLRLPEFISEDLTDRIERTYEAFRTGRSAVPDEIALSSVLNAALYYLPKARFPQFHSTYGDIKFPLASQLFALPPAETYQMRLASSNAAKFEISRERSGDLRFTSGNILNFTSPTSREPIQQGLRLEPGDVILWEGRREGVGRFKGYTIPPEWHPHTEGLRDTAVRLASARPELLTRDGVTTNQSSLFSAYLQRAEALFQQLDRYFWSTPPWQQLTPERYLSMLQSLHATANYIPSLQEGGKLRNHPVTVLIRNVKDVPPSSFRRQELSNTVPQKIPKIKSREWPVNAYIGGDTVLHYSPYFDFIASYVEQATFHFNRLRTGVARHAPVEEILPALSWNYYYLMNGMIFPRINHSLHMNAANYCLALTGHRGIVQGCFDLASHIHSAEEHETLWRRTLKGESPSIIVPYR